MGSPVPKKKTKTKAKTKKKSADARARTPKAATPKAPPYRLRRSAVHGSGLFATRTIPKGELIVEYVGQRISHEEADRRHAEKEHDDGHTWLFTIDSRS